MRQKRWLLCVLAIALLLGLAACAKDNADTNAAENAGTSSGTTLMIYMVGSDLEAKGGAGTKDLEEIIESQVDLSCNNVLVYAGGTKKWHNDTLSADAGHTILRLTADGFQQLETRSEASMGDGETLSYFLNYGYQNYTAENYALILWDHGNGPLIGYGKDMLHEDDALTLLEMQAALENSPFNAEQKLAWVGFDACLMSSVELACIWQGHADYLIASQEIEPSFGWNYSFLNQLGKLDTVSLADEITRQYMDSCLAYYERRGYDQRDTTLACMDLSKLEPLKAALENLFTKAAETVESGYSDLVASRVETRALGRATTGSEYDLIDLVDMAEKMKAHYPAEADAVKQAVQALVVHNVTNTEGCCGLSLYYPFYNKSYYEKVWGGVYADLDVLPSYTAYLEAYAKRWLQNDLLQTVASSAKPQAVSDSEFVLPLTEEQAENFADASYYILQREGDGVYTRIHTSSGVVREGNTLIANFDGNILYAKNKFDQYWIPVTVEHDTVGNYTRYSTYVNLTTNAPLYDQKPEGYVHRVEGHRFHISVNNATNEIKTAALVPYATSVETENLIGGKLEDADLSAWSEYYFLQERHLYLQRDENGTILPLDKWEKTDFLSANVSRVGDGVEFTMAPIPAGEYYLLFEIEDVQGNRYCSDLLPIQSQEVSLPGDFQESLVEASWDSGDKVKLFEQEGITAYLTTVEKYDAVTYALQIENNNDFDVAILGHKLFYNENVDCSDGFFGYFAVPAGETVTDTGFDFGDAQELGMLTELESIQFTLSVVTLKGDRTLIYQKPVNLTLSDYAASLRQDPPEDSFFASDFYEIKAPAYGLSAKNQVLYTHDGVCATLLGMGGPGNDDRLILNFSFENTSTVTKNFAILGLSFDDVFVNQSTGPITVLPGTKIYRTYVLLAEDLALYQLTSASSVDVWVSHMQFATLLGGGGFSETCKYSVALETRGEKAQFKQGDTLLYEDSSVQIFLEKAGERKYGGYEWVCTMVNKGDTGLLLGSADITLNGKLCPTDSVGSPVLSAHDEKCPAGQVTAFTVSYVGDETGDLQLTFIPQFCDFAGEQLLYEGTRITLNTK